MTTSLLSRPAGGAPSKRVLTFRVAAPSRVSKGRRVWFFLSNEFVTRGTQEKSKPRPFKAERVGHPERLNQFLGVDVLEWYNPTVRTCQYKTRERVGHPPQILGIPVPNYPARAAPRFSNGVGIVPTATPSRKSKERPELAGIRSPGTMIPTRFSGSEAAI
jgi:hypothetical protein